MSELKIEVKGVDRVKKRLQKIPKAADRALFQVGAFHVNEIKQRIATTKVDENGRRWAPWSMATQRMRSKTGGSLLNYSGALYSSIRFRFIAQTNSIEFYSSAPYAGFLQYGTNRMPARPFMNVGVKTVEYFKTKFLEKI